MSFGKPKDEKEQTTPGLTPLSSGAPVTSPNGSKPEVFLGKGCKIVGTLTFAGPAEIEGTIEGEIIAQDRLIIGESAIIKGKISGTEIIVKGDVNGDINANKRLSLRRPAKIVGNIGSNVLSIEEGVAFEGKCAMTTTQRNADGKPAQVMSITEKVA
jgi:cytoskeletal protein CcmA (bactofilin family)